MPMRFVTGRAAEVRRRLYDELGAALSEAGERPVMLLVPEQYTLQAELDVMDELNLAGSFRFQVLSPRAACQPDIYGGRKAHRPRASTTAAAR